MPPWLAQIVAILVAIRLHHCTPFPQQDSSYLMSLRTTPMGAVVQRHWMEGNLSLGLHTPLRDWPPDWTQGSNWLFAGKYHQWCLVALKFLNTYQLDEVHFLTAYPEATKGHAALLHAINATRKARGEHKMQAWRGCGS
ncbi:hypothetical protein HD554DRAFT_2040929 [Boletus coccyginus]|nr:hypothetical protein HD554DRAFT_2040929 [Boletus coccyginus]